MIYLIGGAPRVGKSILGQHLSAQLKLGWMSTDLLMELLRLKGQDEAKQEWSVAPETIQATAEFFFPYLERFVWGINSMADGYVIEGVNFLPAQVAKLSTQYPIRSVFLGCSEMTPERFDRYPGRSHGYASLPAEMKRQIVLDVPRWSEFIRREAQRFDYPYVDMGDDFPSHLEQVQAILTAGTTADATFLEPRVTAHAD